MILLHLLSCLPRGLTKTPNKSKAPSHCCQRAKLAQISARQDQTPATPWAHTCVAPTSEGVHAWKEAAILPAGNSAAENRQFPGRAEIEGSFRGRNNSNRSFSRGNANYALPHETGVLGMVFEGCDTAWEFCHRNLRHCTPGWPSILSFGPDINWIPCRNRSNLKFFRFFQYFYNQHFSFVLSLQSDRSHLKFSC